MDWIKIVHFFSIRAPSIDDSLLNTFNSALTSGDTNKFIYTYLILDVKEQSAYCRKFRTNSDVKIKSTAFYKSSVGSKLYLYVNEDKKALVALDREQSYGGLTAVSQLHNVFILKADRVHSQMYLSWQPLLGPRGVSNIYQKDKIHDQFDMKNANIIQ